MQGLSIPVCPRPPPVLSLSGAASLCPCPWNCLSSPKGNILKKNETKTKQEEGEQKRKGGTRVRGETKCLFTKRDGEKL